MTHTKDEALKLASALDHWATQMDMGRKPDPKSLTRKASAELRRLQAELDAIKQSLAQPAHVQEPVGDWVWSWLMGWCKRNGIAPATQDSLFAMVGDARSKFESYPPAAQRQWVGLTDDDKEFIELTGGKSDVLLAELVEAKLRSKNGY
jgi:hypothetical protein